MFRKLVCSMFVMAIGISFVAAEEFTASITKVDGDKITYQKFKKVKGKAPEKDGDAVVVSAKGAKVTFGAVNKDTKKFEATDAIEGGLKNDMFAKIGDKGVNARLVFDGDAKDGKLTVIGITKKKKAAN
jgi:hypothetical protein